MSVVDMDSDEEESLTLSTLKRKLQTNNKCDAEDDIPLNVLAKTLKEGQTNQNTSEKRIVDEQEQISVHTVDHSDYFRSTCENGDKEVNYATFEETCVYTDRVI